MDVRLKFDVASAVVHIDGRFLNAERPNKRNITFLRDYGSTIGLAARMSRLQLKDSDGKAVEYKQLVQGENLAAADVTSWSYDVALKPIGRASSLAHVSWLKGDRGIIFLDDLLPQIGSTAKVAATVGFDLPDEWVTLGTPVGDIVSVSDIERTSIPIAKERTFRKVSTAMGTLFVFDSWQFSDSDVVQMVDEVGGQYRSIFGSLPTNTSFTLMRMPETPVGNWEADSRGSGITILSSDMPFKSQSLQRLHEQLRHEMFHLWLPNKVSFTGSYDWFYEGFALYQSLKIGVGVNRLRFEDVLASLARAYEIDHAQTDRLSLIDASERRWQGANTAVYARGMLAAFLVDVNMLRRSKGKRSVETLLRQVVEKGSNGAITSGNAAVIDAMRSYPELSEITARYITGAAPIDWSDELRACGIVAADDRGGLSLKTLVKPDRGQRDLLDKLGYNNWRKLASKSK